MAAFVAGVNAGGDSSTVTTAAINTTGANLIVVTAVFYAPGGSLTLTDSKGNTWTALTRRDSGSGVGSTLYYCFNPTVGSGHTFTGTNNYPLLGVLSFSGADTSPFDVEAGTTGSGSTIQPGSVTPSTANNIIVSGVGAGMTSGAISIDGSFTEPNAEAVGAAFQVSCAYLIQTSATAQNPTWTIPSGGYGSSAGNAVFKATGGGGGGTKAPPPPRRVTRFFRRAG